MAHTITPSPLFIVRLGVTRHVPKKKLLQRLGTTCLGIFEVPDRFSILLWLPSYYPEVYFACACKRYFNVNSRYWNTQHQFETCWFPSCRSVKFGLYRVDLPIDGLLYLRMQNLTCAHQSLWLQSGDYSVSTRPLQMCVKLIAGDMGTKAGCPRPFLTIT